MSQRIKYSEYLSQLMKNVFALSLVLGTLLGALVLYLGKAEGNITLDVDISRLDSIWFFLGSITLLSLVFLLLSPLSYWVYTLIFRENK